MSEGCRVLDVKMEAVILSREGGCGDSGRRVSPTFFWKIFLKQEKKMIISYL